MAGAGVVAAAAVGAVWVVGSGGGASTPALGGCCLVLESNTGAHVDCTRA